MMAIILLLVINTLASAVSDLHVWFNHLSPRLNPLKFVNPNTLFDCSIKYKEDYYANSFSEDLEDLTLMDSGIDLKFLEASFSEHFCRVMLDEDRFEVIDRMLQEDFILEIRVGGLEFWVPIGEFDSSQDTGSIFTHYELVLFYNGENLSNAKISTSKLVSLELSEKIDFSYSAQWETTNETLQTRISSHNIMQQKTKTLYEFILICNLTLVFILSAIGYSLLYFQIQKDENNNKKTGWLSLHNSIHKPPRFLPLFSSLVSIGCHLGLTLISTIILNCFFRFYIKSGGFAAVSFWSYVLLGSASGFICGQELYKYRKKANPLNLALNSTLLNLIVFCVFLSKSVANAHLMNFESFLIVLISFCVVYTPLYILGYFLGRTFGKNYYIRYSENDLEGEKVNKNEDRPWVLMGVVAGLMFLLIFPALNSIVVVKFAFVTYSSYEFLLGGALVYLGAVIAGNVFVTFVTLEMENAYWYWSPFMIGGEVGGLCFVYGVFVYCSRMVMGGVMEKVYFFMYVWSGSFGVALITGALGYYSAAVFVNKVYSYRKID